MSTKIVYDYQTFSYQEYGGISRYFHEISSRIAKINGYDIEIICPFYINEYFESYPSNYSLLKGFKVKRIMRTNRLRDMTNKQLSKLLLSRSSIDIIHETYYSKESIGSRRAKRVLTVHDMIHEKFSSDLDLDNRYAKDKASAIKRADHIICVSENTRKDLVELLDVDEAKISTIYLASAPRDDFLMNQNLLPQINKPYLLWVGQRDPYKNFTRLLEAYYRSNKLNKDFYLVCFGLKKFSSSEIENIKDLQLQDKVIQISGNDDVLAHLYSQASAFVYPSLYEGFGIPPLEAMSFGCPVVCSNASSIPEVVGNAGEYFDPCDVDSMIEVIEKVVYSQERSSMLKKLGENRVKLFSWELCAEQTMKVYQSLL
jgi:glycosyltransferase involved in cell wall biosynthesis